MGRLAAVWLVFYALPTGCFFDPSSNGGAAAIDSGPMADRDPDAPDAVPLPDVDPSCPGSALQFVPSNFARCDLPAADGSLDIAANADLDTDSGALAVGGTAVDVASVVVTQPGGPDLRIFVADSITIDNNGELYVTGALPAAIVSYSDLTVTGLIDSAGVGDVPGAGGNPAACGAAPDGNVQTPQSNGDNGGSGGGGGGYGAGGAIGARVPTVGPDTAGTAANGAATIVPLRGGCPGGAGGFGNGIGGAGGGALQLVAANAIHIEGIVAVPGGGGGGTSITGGGGGGGGSGGAVLIEAPEIVIDGTVSAHGGGGGEGSRRTDGFTGSGQDGHYDDTIATGGNVSASGGTGGTGGTGSSPATAGQQGTNDGTDAAGGGGGGGSVGRIRLDVDANPTINGLVSPVP